METDFSTMKSDEATEPGERTKKNSTTKLGVTRKPRPPIEPCRSRKLLSDGKPFGGSCGRMTDGMMNKLFDMYGLAIRQGIDEGINNT